jgi:drug/metabolite transporter (DMT)-like permease
VGRRTRATRWAVVYFAVSTGVLIAPAYTWWGNHVEPRVLGLPWSLVSVLLVVAANFAVLGWLYAKRLIDDEEAE